jgi:hypothetical protein
MDTTLLFLLAVLGFSVFMIFYSLRKQKERKKNDVASQPEPDISPFDYYSIIQGRAFQLLESLQIIWTTKNADTFSGRIEFINQFYDKFISASKINLYAGHMAEVIDDYHSKYYDKKLTEDQVGLLLFPDSGKMQLFYADCAVRFYERYVKHQTEEMNTLKTNTAKGRRRDNMIEKGQLVKHFFETYDLPNSGHIDEIEKIMACLNVT